MRRGVRWIVGLAGALAFGIGVALLLGWDPARHLEIRQVHEDLPDGGTITMTEVTHDGGMLGAWILIAAGGAAVGFAMRRPTPAR